MLLTLARPIVAIPAGRGPAGTSATMFEEDAFGPTRTRVRVPVPLSYLMMVAALADADGEITRVDLATPADVRWQVEFEIAYRGWDAVHQAAERVADARIIGNDWLLFCHRSIINMLHVEGIASGVDQLTPDELTAALTLYGEIYPMDPADTEGTRQELTRIAYTHGVDALRAVAAQMAAHPYEVNAPSFDTDAHAWPGFCRQAVTAMLADTGALVGAW